MIRLFAFNLTLALVAVSPLGVAAEPEVDFDFSTNTGIVAAPYVQSLLQLNSGQMKKYAGDISFDASQVEARDVNCDVGPPAVSQSPYIYEVIPSLIQSRRQVTAFEFSGLIGWEAVGSPIPVEDLCSGPGTIDESSSTITKTLRVSFGWTSFILFQEIDFVIHPQ